MGLSVGTIIFIVLGALLGFVLLALLFLVLSVLGIVEGIRSLIDSTNEGVKWSKKGYGYTKRKLSKKKEHHGTDSEENRA